jgi:hypothetical protein
MSEERSSERSCHTPERPSEEVFAAMMGIAEIMMEFPDLPYDSLVSRLKAQRHSFQAIRLAIEKHVREGRLDTKDYWAPTSFDDYGDPYFSVSIFRAMRYWYEDQLSQIGLSNGVEAVNTEASPDGSEPKPQWDEATRDRRDCSSLDAYHSPVRSGFCAKALRTHAPTMPLGTWLAGSIGTRWPSSTRGSSAG